MGLNSNCEVSTTHEKDVISSMETADLKSKKRERENCVRNEMKNYVGVKQRIKPSGAH